MRPLDYIKLIRPKQWTKNLLVFAALIFTGNFGNASLVQSAVLAFVAMCLASSSIYIFNDILDVERDRAHPIKSKRPIASGSISIPIAIAIGLVFAGVAITISHTLNLASLSIVIIYLVMQVAYNFALKRMPVADVFTIAIGFILRATLGAAAVGVQISGWLLFCTGALALMLGFGKRRHEFLLQGDERAKSRESLGGYTLQALDVLVTITACGAGLSYAVYSVDSRTAHLHPGLILTSPFVFYGVCRYLYVVFGKNEGGEPETLLFSDKHIIFTLLAFVVVTGIAVKYGINLKMLDTGR